MRIALAILALALSGCCDGLTVPAAPGPDAGPATEHPCAEPVPLKTYNINACSYVLPEGSDCHVVRVFVDDVELAREYYSATCIPPLVTLSPCDGTAVRVSICE